MGEIQLVNLVSVDLDLFKSFARRVVNAKYLSLDGRGVDCLVERSPNSVGIIVVSAALEFFDDFWSVALFAGKNILQIENSKIAESLIVVHNEEELVTESELDAGGFVSWDLDSLVFLSCLHVENIHSSDCSCSKTILGVFGDIKRVACTSIVEHSCSTALVGVVDTDSGIV